MPRSARDAARVSLANCGSRRDPGKRRTSATSSMPFASSAPVSSSIERVEWPMVQTVGVTSTSSRLRRELAVEPLALLVEQAGDDAVDVALVRAHDAERDRRGLALGEAVGAGGNRGE